jgi:hypothetical protein
MLLIQYFSSQNYEITTPHYAVSMDNLDLPIQEYLEGNSSIVTITHLLLLDSYCLAYSNVAIGIWASGVSEITK